MARLWLQGLPFGTLHLGSLMLSDPSRPDVSVIVPSFNAERFIAETLDSILNQEGVAIELIAVNDGSTDGTLAVLQQYAGRITVLDQPNQGQAAARNAGAKVARGACLAFVDSDDVLLPGALQALFAATDTSAGVVYGDAEFINETSTVGARTGYRRPTDDPLRDMCLGMMFQPSASIVVADLFRSVGGFDGATSPAEDWDLMFKLATKTSFRMIDRPVLQYRIHSQSQSRNYPRMLERALGVLQVHASTRGLRIRCARAILVGRLKIGYYFVEEHRKAVRAGSVDTARQGRRTMLRYPWLYLVMAAVPVLKPMKHSLRRRRMAGSGAPR